MSLPENKQFLAIEIGGTKLQIVAFTEKAEVIKRWRFKIDKQKGAAGIRELINETISEIKNEIPLTGIGVGFGGPVDCQKGTICVSHQIEGWSDFPIADWLTELSGVPAWIDNDANVAALGEATYGAGSSFPTVFYMTIGSGVGGGVVQNKSLYHGQLPGEAEIGHLLLDFNGTTLESQCSGWAMDGKVRAAVAANPESILADFCQVQANPGGETAFLSPALARNCPVAKGLLDELSTKLAWALSHVVHLFHPDVLILGGGVSLLGEPLRMGISERLPSFCMKAFQPPPIVALAGLGEEVVPLGALALALQKTNN